jgi:dTDP-4-dehydrorhamnose 3,5-epimerase
MPFKFERLAIPEIIIITPEVFPDNRGFFMETYKYSDFAAFGIKERFIQDNYSCSIKGVLRGLHYQRYPKAQGKLVQVIRGVIFDVAVDIRKGSPTYGKWVGLTLSAENKQMLYIPPDFAHGFCTLSEKADVIYKVTEEYAPGHDTGIIWNDPEIGIHWPIEQPIISVRDAMFPSLKEAQL